MKRKPKPIKSSEKENEGGEGTKSPRKSLKSVAARPKVLSPGRPLKSRDFTVDIFTSKSFEEKEGERRDQNVEEEAKSVLVDKVTYRKYMFYNVILSCTKL